MSKIANFREKNPGRFTYNDLEVISVIPIVLLRLPPVLLQAQPNPTLVLQQLLQAQLKPKLQPCTNGLLSLSLGDNLC
jgi:hypothetical protein